MTFIYPSDVSLLKDAFFDPLDNIRSLRHALKHSAPYHCNTIIMWFLLDYCWIMCSISGLFSLSCSSVKAGHVCSGHNSIPSTQHWDWYWPGVLSLLYKGMNKHRMGHNSCLQRGQVWLRGDKPAGVVWWVLGGNHTVLENQKQRPLSQCECPGKHSAGI